MHRGTDSFYLPTQTFLRLLQQPWHLLSPAGKARHLEAVAMGARDVTSFKRPSEIGKGKMSKPETSKQHLTDLSFLLPCLFLNILLELSSPRREGSG